MRSVPALSDACSHCSCCHGDGGPRWRGRPARAAPAHDLDAAALDRLVKPESREETIASLVEATDVHALPILRALLEETSTSARRRCWSTGKARSRMRSPVLRHRSTESSWSR